MEKIFLDRRGLNGEKIKFIAMFLMVLDHLHYFLIQAGVNIPIWFTWLGRIVAPLFIFMTVEGYSHTSNKKRYLMRLYIAFVLMGLGNGLITSMFPMEPVVPLINSMFGSLFLLVIHLGFVDIIINGLREKKLINLIGGLILLLLPSFINLMIMQVLTGPNANINLLRVLMILIPMPLVVEGGPTFILLGIILYLLRSDRKKQIIAYILFCLPFILSTKFDIQNMLFTNYQWMMIFATPFMFLYNEEKGKGYKYLFYVFYPLHIYVIYIVTWFIVRK